MSALGLHTPLTGLPRMTPARAKALGDHGLLTVHDLLRHYPRRHEDRRKFPDFPSVGGPEPVCLRGRVVETKFARFGRRCQFSLTLEDPSDTTGRAALVRCRWFNLRYLTNVLKAGQDLVIFGRARSLAKGGVAFDHPDFEVLETDASDSDLIHLNRITPVHPSIGPWSPRLLRRLMFETLSQVGGDDPPLLWAATSESKAGISALAALRAIHFPGSSGELEQARAALAGDELFEMQCVLARQRSRQCRGTAPIVERRRPLLARFLKQLPYDLTSAQKRVLAAIFDDLESGRPMNRLLHGDVGSGKTVVAAAAIVGAVAAGHSAALMAPTQILARQHHETLCRQLEPLGIPVTLLTAAHKKAPPREGPRVTVGTHALLFASDTLGQPSLVVIDEQHRFGVRQRARLAARAPHPHVLVMSATPIPRTLALTLYGDLDLSLLDEMPPGRHPVRTVVRPHDKLEEAAAFVRTQLDRGRQAFLVYPVIEEGKRKELKAASGEFDRWSALLAPHRCALLHGRLEAAEKDAVMDSFRRGEARALVCTTVIEVGIDVPDAGILLVENAERFGLAQLHQLRGRVGRGGDKAWCILLAGEQADERLDRLKILETATDGFSIAEADLALRGPGDLLGTAQTGLPPIRLAQLPRDLPLLEAARHAARDLLATDPELTDQPVLRARLEVWEKQLFAGVA